MYRKKLFIVFVDFSKVYDRLDIVKLVNILKKLGCGMVMLAAIVALYVCTNSILGTSVITTVLACDRFHHYHVSYLLFL